MAGTPAAKFCYSAYMNQKLEMIMMDQSLVLDGSFSNLSLDLTDEEHGRCVTFMTCLEGNASYDYLDAMVLMPMAPKSKTQNSFASSVFNLLVEDRECSIPQDIKKVFCSQSVVLMLRYALDADGRHSGLLERLNSLNSRLVSPKQVQEILVSFGATDVSNEDLAGLATM